MEPLISSRDMRRVILEQAYRAGVGHIGSALSSADIVATLYASVLRGRAGHPDRDRFILSNGHAALALYAALHLAGRLSGEELDRYCGNASRLGVHPQHSLIDVDFTTGSLGQGLALGAGATLAARLEGSSRRAYVVLSDAECNEGSVWETAMFAAHQRLAGLVAVIDLNQQQALGYTREVLDLSPMAERWRAFGWDAVDVDGHDREALLRTCRSLEGASGPPHVIVAHTTFGHGVSFMESQIKWHYSPLSAEDYERAVAEVMSRP